MKKSSANSMTWHYGLPMINYSSDFILFRVNMAYVVLHKINVSGHIKKINVLGQNNKSHILLHIIELLFYTFN